MLSKVVRNYLNIRKECKIEYEKEAVMCVCGEVVCVVCVVCVCGGVCV